MASIARRLRLANPRRLAIYTKLPIAHSICQIPSARAFSASAIKLLRKYTKDHEWIDVSADNKTGVIGISEFAAEALGDVVYVELPEEGRVFRAGDAIGAVESVKSAADINSPVSCTITDVNLTLEEKPSTINKVPEDDSNGGGWLAKIELAEEGIKELEGLMDAAAYKEFTSEVEEH